MNRSGSRWSRSANFTCAVLMLASLPLLVRAQATKPPAAPPSSMPATSSMPAAVAEPMRKATAMTDSARLAFRADVDRQLKQMADTLKLSPQQRANARPILLDHAYQVKQLRDKYAPMERTPANREAMTKEMQTLRDATDAKLAGVLSADQLTQYKTMRDAALVKMRAKMASTEAKPEEKK